MRDSSGPNLEQYQFVANLIERQDEVLQQLDELQRRIEAQIQEVNDSRQTEDTQLQVTVLPSDEVELDKAA